MSTLSKEEQYKCLKRFLVQVLEPQKKLSKEFHDKLVSCRHIPKPIRKGISDYYQYRKQTIKQAGGIVSTSLNVNILWSEELDRKTQIILGNYIKGGGYGVVYEVQDESSQVVKIMPFPHNTIVEHLLDVFSIVRSPYINLFTYNLDPKIQLPFHDKDKHIIGYKMKKLSTISEQRSLNLNTLTQIFDNALMKVNIMHQTHRIIHLDLKLDNIMLDENNVVIVDYDGCFLYGDTNKMNDGEIEEKMIKLTQNPNLYAITPLFTHPFIMHVLNYNDEHKTMAFDHGLIIRNCASYDQIANPQFDILTIDPNSVNETIFQCNNLNSIFTLDYGTKPFELNDYKNFLRILKFCDLYSLGMSFIAAVSKHMQHDLNTMEKLNTFKNFRNHIIGRLQTVKMKLNLPTPNKTMMTNNQKDVEKSDQGIYCQRDNKQLEEAVQLLLKQTRGGAPSIQEPPEPPPGIVVEQAWGKTIPCIIPRLMLNLDDNVLPFDNSEIKGLEYND